MLRSFLYSRSRTRLRLKKVISSVFLLTLFVMPTQFSYAQDTISIGIGTATNTTTSYPCPLQDYYEGGRNQYLYRASELIAAGMDTGYISHLSFLVLTANSGTFPAIEQLEIKIGTTSVDSLTPGGWTSGLSTLYGPTNYTVTTGDNIFALSCPFYWNGVDNIIIETCNGDPANTSYVSYTTNPLITWTTGLTFQASRSYRADNAGNLCGSTVTTENGIQTTRPNIKFYTTATALANDVAVASVSALLNACATGGDSVAVTIQNAGTATQTNIPIMLSVNGGSYALATTYSGSLTGCSSVTINLPVSGITSMGSQTLAVATNLSGDGNNANDSASVSAFKSFALSGTYTLGGSSADFPNFTALTSTLSQCGIVGPTTINVTANSGPFTEQVIFQNISGLSASEPLTINGNGNTIQFDGGSTGLDYRIVGFSGVSHITFDNFTIKELGTSTSFGVHFGNGADTITVSNCSIDMTNATVLSTTVAGIVTSGSFTSTTTTTTTPSSYLTIEDNTIFGGFYYGIVMYASVTTSGVGNVISGNTIEDFYSMGIRIYYQDGCTIANNDVSSPTFASSTTRYGLYLDSPSDTCIIDGNWIHDLFGGAPTYTGTGYGIFTSNFDATSGNSNVLINNIISDFEWAGTQYGIYSSSSDYLDIAHNTISLDHQSAATSPTYGIFQTTGATGINIVNNLISVTRATTTTNASPLRFNTTTSSIYSDYNVLWIDTNSTTMKTGYFGATAYADLAAWQTANAGAYDSLSLQLPPIFTSATNYTPLSSAIDNVGTPVGLTYDFYNASRSASTPDVGAIEFTGLPGDMSIESGEIVRESLCYGTNDTVRVTVKNVLGATVNFSTNPLSGSWSVAGPVSSSGTFGVTTGTLTEGSTLTIDVTGANLSQPGTYTLNVNIDTNAVNPSTGNDTLTGAGTATVQDIFSVTPLFDTITSPFDSVLVTASSPLFPGGSAKFSEIVQFKTTTGQPAGGWATVSWITDDDHLELIGAPNATLAGYTVQTYASNAATPSYNFTFSPGASFNSNGVAVLGWGGTAGNVNTTYNYYSAGISATGLGSTTVLGYILRDPSGTIVDVVVNGTTFTWNAATGVTASDWATNMTAGSGSTSGIRRTAAADNNTGTDWVVSSTTFPQDPGTYNSSVNAITLPFIPGITWSYLSSPVSYSPSTFVGPWTSNGDYTYIATLDSVCGIYIDSAQIHVNLTTAEITAFTNLLCNGAATGSATAASTGGDAPFTYLWSDGQTTATASNLLAATYSVTVTDANGWSDSASVTLTEPTALSNTMSVTPSGCGAANGALASSVSGGVAPYTYTWSNGGNTASISTLSSGTYTLTVTDANGCTYTESIAVNDAGAPNIGLTVTNAISCNGGNNGAITASVSGGATPYTYAWSGSASTTNVAASLSAGTYTLTVTDSLGCAVSGSQVLTQPTVLVASSSVVANVSCNGGTDGSVSSSATGGTSPYTYVWSNAATTASISALAAGSYTVTITDANGCTSTSSKTVTQPTALVASVPTVNNVTCNGLSDGSLTASQSGGTTGYTYLWSTGAVTASATGLAAGSYTVTVTDANGCTSSATATVSQPTVLDASITSINDALCFGSTDGDATANGSGGTAPYTYLWSSSAATALAGSLGAGTYTVTVTDANGCTDTASATVGQPTLLVASIIDSSDATCFGFSDGGAEASATGGTVPYAYAWSGSQTGSVVTTLNATTHTVTVTDDNGCTATAVVSIGEPTQLANVFSVTNLSCNSSGDGAILSTPSGSVAPYSYAWSTSDSTQGVSGLSAGMYTLTITDSNGCVLEVSEVVTQPDSLISSVDSVSNLLCNGDGNGVIITSAMGGTMPYTYLWSNAATTDSIGGLSGGTYSLTVTDTNGCTTAISAFVNEPAELISALTATDVSCFGQADGSISNAVTGGTAAYAYVWNTGETTADLNGLTPGTFNVTVTDANGCSAEATASISQPDSIDASVSVGTLGDDVVLTANADSATYQWINCETNTAIAGETNASFAPSDNGSYAVVVTVGDCSDTSACQEVGNVGVGAAPFSANQMVVFPNPTRGTFNVRFDGSYGTSVRIEVVTMEGKVIVAKPLGQVSNGQIETIDIQAAAGIYFVKAYNDSSMMIQRLVIN